MTNARLEELRSKFQENPRRYFAPFANELRKAGDPGQAIAVCRTHLALQPGHVSGHIVLGQALYEAGEPNDARDVFTSALELDPENLIALRTLGEISQVNGDFVSARQWYERLLDADPRNSEVTQLIRDLPTGNVMPASPEPSVQAHSAETSLEEHQAQERNAFAPPAVPVPSFHSGFTGPGPAYKSAEDLAEEERQATAQRQEDAAPMEAVELVEMDATSPESMASTPVAENTSWQQVPEHGHDEPIDMVDLDSFSPEEPVAEPVAMAMPDEPRVDAAEPAAEMVDFSFTPPAPDAVAGDEEKATPELEMPVEDGAEEFEQPRALFAEHGFEGPAGDQVGWMLTPSAVESDLESAPENWFDVPTEQAQEIAVEEQSAPASPVAANEVAGSEDEGATDSWFDDVPGASAVAPVEGVTTEDFWLPPDLSQVRTTPVGAAPEPEPEPLEDAAEPPSYTSEAVVEEAPAVEERVVQPVAPDAFAAPVVAEAFDAPVGQEFVAPVAEEEVEPPVAEEFVVPAAEEPAQPPVAEEFAAPVADESFEAPVAEDAFEVPVAYSPAEDSLEPIERAPLMESTTPAAETEAFEDTHGAAIEYFDHTAPNQSDGYAEAPVAEWSEPAALQASEHPEPDVQPVAAQEPEPVHTWEPAAAETSDTESVEPESQPEPIMESSPVAEEHDALVVASSVPDETRYPEPVVGHTPPMAESATQATPAPFVTETLAELYLQQGFRDEALSIYRQLVEREPSNLALRDRMEAIERRESEQPSVMPQFVASERAASQSVRTFFSKLARRPAVGAAGQSATTADTTPQPDVPFASAASALANLFAASRPPAADEGAAATLAGAYTNPTGRPTRAADRELSLDHLFRDVPPGGSQTGGMSMDEFYSAPNAEAGSPTEPGEARESPESGGTDIRQFTAWLEGLRKK